MGEAAGGGRAEMEGRLIQRSLEDEPFRQRMLEAPRSVVEEDLGTRLPEGIEVRAVEDTANTIYPVLPPPTFSAALREGEMLSEIELETVAGGWDPKTWSGHTCGLCGIAQGWTYRGGH